MKFWKAHWKQTARHLIEIGLAAQGCDCLRHRTALGFEMVVVQGPRMVPDERISMPKDDALIAELTAPTYSFTSIGKMVVKSKADVKKRGMRSPDLADAFSSRPSRAERGTRSNLPQAGAPQFLPRGRC